MKAIRVVLSVSAGAACFAAVGLSIFGASLPGNGVIATPATDPLISGSIPRSVSAGPAAVTDIAALAVSPPAVFSLSNFTTRSVCLVERGGRLAAGNRNFFAPADCEAVWPGLPLATAWAETESGEVHLLDADGRAVLSLVRGRNFAYQLSRPGGPELALLMLP